MWGARFTELVDPSPFPFHSCPLCNYTFTIPTLAIILLHVINVWIMVLHVLPMSNCLLVVWFKH